MKISKAKYLLFFVLFLVGCTPLMDSDIAVIRPGDTYTFKKEGLYMTEGRLYGICQALWMLHAEAEPDVEYMDYEWQTSH